MILIGFTDLSIRQIFNILENSSVKLDSKLLSQFNTEPYKGKSVKPEPCTLQVPEQDYLFNRALLVTLTCFVFRHKKHFSLPVLQSLVDSLNENKLAVDTKSPFLWSNSSLSENELQLFNDNAKEIVEGAFNLSEFYLLCQISKLHKIEACVFLEVNKIGFNFLTEIEKGNYDNRKIARCVNLYKNFYKAKTSGKSEPENSLVQEVYLGYQIDEALGDLQEGIRDSLTYTEK